MNCLSASSFALISYCTCQVIRLSSRKNVNKYLYLYLQQQTCDKATQEQTIVQRSNLLYEVLLRG